jgi:hypothetical protein
LRETWSARYWKILGLQQTRPEMNLCHHFTIKSLGSASKERILKATTEKPHITIKIIADFSTETLKARRM